MDGFTFTDDRGDGALLPNHTTNFYSRFVCPTHLERKCVRNKIGIENHGLLNYLTRELSK
jgi:hypothetical protein